MATVRGNLTEWDSFYKTRRWQQLRKLQLQRHPLCKFCLERKHSHGSERGGSRHPAPGRLERFRAWRAAESVRAVP
jgi:5-methylcytosine-specific restriction endonuclease McrA